tara:strand:- start:343 stop:807 length:465 start_codon:yes stop_codon:yes gene_type:complete
MIVSCVSTKNIPTNISSEIPDDANAIKLYSDNSASKLYSDIYKSLAQKGFSFAQENKDMGTISTDFKDIEQGTTLKINVFVEESDDGSIATLRGAWGVTSSFGAGLTAATGSSLGGTSAEEANWGKSGRPKVAFGELAVIANDINHKRLEYVSE